MIARDTWHMARGTWHAWADPWVIGQAVLLCMGVMSVCGEYALQSCGLVLAAETQRKFRISDLEHSMHVSR